MQYWQKHFPKMKIRPPSEDTCNECWKYTTELRTISRRMKSEVRRRNREENSNDIIEGRLNEAAESGSDMDISDSDNDSGIEVENRIVEEINGNTE